MTKPEGFTIQEGVAEEAITLSPKSGKANPWSDTVRKLKGTVGIFIVTGDTSKHRALALSLHRAAKPQGFSLTITGGKNDEGQDGLHVREATPDEAALAEKKAVKARELAEKAKAAAAADATPATKTGKAA